ncbi:elastase-like [Haliotis rufescens]|uniref:elastase-like n=1 Tax=Haliotis rufescens TaxID=6454 RepID=UPI00201F7DB1|nr:elastase-like [Haliotis rufescens]
MRNYIFFLTIVAAFTQHEVQSAKRMSARDKLTRVSTAPLGYLTRQPPEMTETHRAKRSAEGASIRPEEYAEEILGLKGAERFETVKEVVTVHGVTLRKMKERYRDRDVFDTIVTVKVDDDNETLVDASGSIVEDIETELKDFDHELSDEKLYDILIIHNNDENITESIGNRKIVYDVHLDDNGTAIPIAIVEYLIETEEVVKRPMAIINTRTGEVIKAWNNLQTCFPNERHKLYGGNEKIGKREYGIIPQCLEVRKEGNTCYLENDLVRVVDMQHTELENITETASFDCDQTYNDSINGAYSPALDALYFGTQIQKMFLEWFGHKLVDDLVMRVHFSKNHVNAFWNGKNVTFGDGRRRMVYPFVALDIAAHEIAHGFSEHNAGLLYVSQTGGINEAFSDMAGEMAELYLDMVDWRVGYAIMWPERSMRYLDDPPKNGRSIKHMKKYKEGIDPHGCSGIYNRVFYLLCQEYSDDPRDVFRVFLLANKMYWHPLSNFSDGACDIMKAVYDLGQTPEHYIKSFDDVGIEACDIKDHILHLRHNKTRNGVTVSRSINPVFAIEVPEWASSFYIQTTSGGGKDILIEIITESWNRQTRNTVPVADENNYLEYNVTNLDSRYFFIRFSTKSRIAIKDVSVRAGYFCLDYYTHRNFLYRAFYALECWGIDLWAG